MRRIIAFMHISLDGFVAGLNGEMNWIRVDEEIFDYVGRRINQCKTAMYGRITFQMMEDYWPAAGDQPDSSRHDIDHSAWYKKVQKVVLSKTLDANYRKDLVVVNDNLTRSINEIKQYPDNGSNEILLFGSPGATHSLVHQNLVDGYWLFVNPVILGQGIPLFSGISDKIMLKLISTRKFNSGVTELNYLVDSK